ncbi:hypothetical protein GGR57DRAFT_52255 [Xylariaceae sp. FL1272]|nr:hypothetical protein GGR57DRAFT_52255 [Xylariaceae sp. FL1272]
MCRVRDRRSYASPNPILIQHNNRAPKGFDPFTRGSRSWQCNTIREFAYAKATKCPMRQVPSQGVCSVSQISDADRHTTSACRVAQRSQNDETHASLIDGKRKSHRSCRPTQLGLGSCYRLTCNVQVRPLWNRIQELPVDREKRGGERVCHGRLDSWTSKKRREASSLAHCLEQIEAFRQHHQPLMHHRLAWKGRIHVRILSWPISRNFSNSRKRRRKAKYWRTCISTRKRKRVQGRTIACNDGLQEALAYNLIISHKGPVSDRQHDEINATSPKRGACYTYYTVSDLCCGR